MSDAATKNRARITNEQLYQLDRFNVHVGAGNVGFCTVWNEPKAVLTRAPELYDIAAIIGTLYSSQGVNIILRNLALNPFIRRLYIWGHGTLSNTKFGTVGSTVLQRLWAQGVGEGGKVADTSFTLEAEIGANIIDTIRANVQLVDVSQQELGMAVATAKSQNSELETAPYMDPVRFPDAVTRTPDTFPSEQVGWVIRGRGVIDTWTRVVERIMRYGIVKGTQYGGQQKELIGVTWVIHDEDPSQPRLPTDWPKELQETVGATQDAINEYHQVFLSPDKPSGVSYTYGNRLMRYPAPNAANRPWVDQVAESLIANLKKSPDTRRAVATTLVPWIDTYSDEPPCITQVQAIQSNHKLHVLVVVRSHDIFKAAVPNAFGLRLLQSRVAGETGFELGALQITSQSAHIYEGDWENANKLAACAFWERPVQKMYDAAQADPRGIFLIRLHDKKIKVEFSSLNGQSLLQLEGVSADRLGLQIAQHELISQSGHALDIGIQLARAEIALKKGIDFTQDRPLAM